MSALPFLLLALLGFGGVAYVALSGRRQDLALLDRRMTVQVVEEAPVRIRRAQTSVAVPDRFAPLLAQAQVEPTPHLIAMLLGLFAISFAIVFALAGIGAGLFAVGAEIALLFFYLTGRARRRRNALVEALPFYLDGVRQLMTIGNSLPQALTRALPAAADPVRSFLGPAVRRVELGASVGEAMQQLADRLDIAEIAMLSAAIRVNIRFGGPMATILGNLGQIVRERVRIKRELASATAEVKVSTQLLIIMPLLLVAFLFFSNPAYRHFFFDDARGHKLAIAACVLQGLGMVVMARMKRMAF